MCACFDYMERFLHLPGMSQPVLRALPVQALVTAHRSAAALEEQARAVEYGAMFGTPETLRGQLLERMPPLDAAAYARSVAAAGTLTSSAAPPAMVTAYLGCCCPLRMPPLGHS